MKRLVGIALLGLAWGTYAQQLDKIGQKDMFKVNGGIGWNMSANMVDDQQRSRDPFTWVSTGSINITFLGVSMPFTFSISNKKTTYTQPFNKTAIHPSYKWVKTHIGVTSMSFSSYTYNGLNFAGGGLELTPKKWTFKGFYGRLRKAVEYDPVANNLYTASYRRMGGAFSVGYQNKGIQANLIVFKAADDPHSLQFTTPNQQLSPMNNLVTSLQLKVPLVKGLNWQLEGANSLLTRNVLLSGQDGSSVSSWQRLTNGNSSTVSRNAYNTSLNYQYKFFSFAVKYERVDADYQTLGALYFNNDLENYTIAPGFNLLKGKLTVMSNFGFQHNNLSQDKANQMKRWVGTLSLNAQPFKGFTSTLNYSNFSSFTRRNPAADPFYNPLFDTMNVYQVTQSFNSVFSYAFGKKNTQAITASYGYNVSSNITGSLTDAGAFGFNVGAAGNPATVHNGLVSYTSQVKRLEMALSATANYNRSDVMDIVSEYFGPGINMQKKLLKKKLSTQLGATYNQQYTNGSLASHVMNWRVGANYSPEWWNKKYGKIAFALNANYAHRFAMVKGGLTPKSLTLIFNLNYSF